MIRSLDQSGYCANCFVNAKHTKKSAIFLSILIFGGTCFILQVNKEELQVPSIRITDIHLLWKHFLSSLPSARATSFPISVQQISVHDDRPQIIEYRQAYVVRRNYILSSEYYVGNLTVTLTTQGTYEYLHHVEELCIRWKAPVSVAVYAPGTEFILASQRIFYMQACAHPCIKANVTWHLFYDKNHPPAKNDAAWIADVSKFPDCSIVPKITTSNYRKANKLAYPINIARNVARLQASTHYVFASDIELYPSPNIVPRFLNLISNRLPHVPEVYVLPVFEIKTGLVPPTTKKELVTRISKKEVFFFHQRICDICHRFPNRNDWLKVFPSEDSLSVFVVTKRKHRWEPFYIGSNKEPVFDENLSWEGKRDKMLQVFEMCLQGYDFCVLDNAFLVHAPGIKRFNAMAERFRNPYIMKNNKYFSNAVIKLKRKYEENMGNSCR